ncbi:MAG: site-specific integrase [Lacticaseibacillus songhuajiangensis]|jgi:integrase|nr:site-specific integrase [Lacticaseibacillus songhuajiangensis]
MASFKKYETKRGEFWQFKCYLGVDPQTGRQRTTTRRGFKTKREASNAAAAFQLAVNRGDMGKKVQKKYTFAEVYEEWFDNYVNTVTESTWVRTQGFFQIHILPAFGHKRIETVTTRNVQTAVKKWAGMTTTNYKKWFTFTKRIFQYAKRQGYCRDNPCDAVELPRHQDRAGDKTPNYWNRQQIQQFFCCIDRDKEPETYAMFYTLIASGMRRGEMLALTWGDVSFKNGTLRVNKTLSQGLRGRTIVDPPKTRSSRRTIQMDAKSMHVLQHWRMIQAQQLLALGLRMDAEKQLVFANIKNGFHSLDTPHKRLRKICDDNGLQYITVHGFRHSAVSNLLSAGVDVSTVQKRMGHASPEITLRVYAHISKEQAQEGADKLAKYLNL